MTGRLTLSCLIAFCLSAGATTASPDSSVTQRDDVISLRDRIRGWTRPVAGPTVRPLLGAATQERGEAMAALAGTSIKGARCATPLLTALYQNSLRLNRPTRTLVARVGSGPVSPTATWRLSPGGEFRVHYLADPISADRVDLRDGNLNGVPDGVERVASELTDTLANFTHVLSWPPAPAPQAGRSPDGVVDVYLVSLDGGSSIEGFVMPRLASWQAFGALEEADHPEASDAVIFLDSRLASHAGVSRAAVAHMVAHLIQFRESAREAPWWHEASATWLENRLEKNAGTVAATYASQASRRSRGLSNDLLGMGMEAFLWPHYLTQSSDSDATLLRRMWEEMAAVPGNNTFDAMDRVLRHALASSLAEEIKVFNVWNLFLGKADDGGHYPFGALLPTPQSDAAYEVFPAGGASLPGPLAPLSASRIQLLGDGSPGGIRFRFFGGIQAAWDVSLLVHSASVPGDVRHVPVEVDEVGRAHIAIPWRQLAAIDVVIQNLSTPGATAADYTFAVDYDPAVPYDLLSFVAAEAGAEATLTWTTESETRLAGWNILRGPAPLGPFSRINKYLLPGAGGAGNPVGYVFVDSSVESGRKYYYQLQGVTFEGFTEPSHPAGVRLQRPSSRIPHSD